MTSKSLCFKLMREDLKRRTWTTALTILGFVFTLLVPVALKSSSYVERVSMGLDERVKQRLINEMVRMVGMNGMVIAVLLALSVVWAISGFRYLHNSRQVDFYHSIPVKRHQLFMASYLNGILVPMAIYLASQVLSVALILRTGIGAYALGSEWWRIFLLNLAYYGMMYTTVIIAVMMTGNLIITLLGTAVFCAYGPAMASLVLLYKSQWFQTYYETKMQMDAWRRAVCYSSPFANYMFALERFASGGWGVKRLAAALAATAALAFLAYGLYRIRPSESAGKAMAFPKTQSPIKHLIALPVGVVFGMFFYELRDTLPWAVFGVLCGSVLTCCIMEIIYHFDFRKLFANRIHLAACFLISLLFVLAGMYDWYGYDSWLPDAKSVKSAAVLFGYDDGWVTYGDVKLEEDYADRENANWRWSYVSEAEYGFENMELTDIYPVMELGKMGVESSRKNRQQRGEERETWGYGSRCIVAYRLNNGRTIYREYRILYEKLEDLEEMRASIYDSREYKMGRYPILKQTAGETAKVCFQQYNRAKELDLTQEDTGRLLAVYQKDLEELTMETRKREVPIGTIQFRTRKLEEAIAWNDRIDYGSRNLRERCYYPVYPSFSRTLEELGQAGVKLVKLDAAMVSDIRIQYYWEADEEYFQQYGGENTEAAFAGTWEKAWEEDSGDGRIEIYDSREDIEALLPALVFNEYCDMNDYYEMETPANAKVYVMADLDALSGRNDKGGISDGFRINMKKLSGEDIRRFGLAKSPN